MHTDNDFSPHEEAGNNSNKLRYLNSLDTARLQALLQQESFLCDDDDFDADLVRHIMSILDEREPIGTIPDVNASFKSFKEEILPELEKEKSADNQPLNDPHIAVIRPKKFRRRFATILIAAIISVLLGSALIASAFGYNIWEYMVSWGKDTFQIGTGAKVMAVPSAAAAGQNEAHVVQQQKCKTLEETKKALTFYVLMPNWLPDGFKFSSANIVDADRQKNLTIMYKSDEKNIIFSARVDAPQNAGYFYEKDEDSGESVEAAGRTCYMMTNIDRNVIVWVDGTSVYSIDGNVSKEDLIKMVNSVYKSDADVKR